MFFWFQGATLVIPFATLELAAVGLAFLVYARHAADGERISLRGGALLSNWSVLASWSAPSFQVNG